MTKSTRARYTLEFKQEAARLVESGQTTAAAARSLGVVEQTLGNWVKAHRAGTLKGVRAEMTQNMLWTSEGTLGVVDPVVTEEGSQPCCEAALISQM
jgi:transposase-like protein